MNNNRNVCGMVCLYLNIFIAKFKKVKKTKLLSFKNIKLNGCHHLCQPTFFFLNCIKVKIVCKKPGQTYNYKSLWHFLSKSFDMHLEREKKGTDKISRDAGV